MDNADFKSPNVQKSMGDTPGDLARILVKCMILIPFSGSILLGKQFWIVMRDCLLCLDAIQQTGSIVSKDLDKESYFKCLYVKTN